MLTPTKAYDLLKAYRSITIEGGVAKIHLNKPVDLLPIEMEQVLMQIKATHEQLEKGIYNPIRKIEFIMPQVIYKNLIANSTKELPNSMWCNIRKRLITLYGEAVDISWFSKLDSTEDSSTKEINLTAPSEFFKDWIQRNYEHAIEQTAATMGIKIRGLS